MGFACIDRYETFIIIMTYLTRDLVKNGILSSLAPSLEHVRRVFPEAAADRKLLNLAPFSLSRFDYHHIFCWTLSEREE